jgi:hypothetical protein
MIFTPLDTQLNSGANLVITLFAYPLFLLFKNQMKAIATQI